MNFFIKLFFKHQFHKIISLLKLKKLTELKTKKNIYVYTNLELSKPNINHMLLFKIFRNLTPLKQRHFHQ